MAIYGSGPIHRMSYTGCAENNCSRLLCQPAIGISVPWPRMWLVLLGPGHPTDCWSAWRTMRWWMKPPGQLRYHSDACTRRPTVIYGLVLPAQASDGFGTEVLP